MRQQDHLGLWIGLVVLLSLLTIALLFIALFPPWGPSEPLFGTEATVTSIKPATPGAIAPTFGPTRTLPTTIPSPIGSMPTAAPGQCKNNATLLKHVTTPEGTPLQPNQGFTKTWQVQNVGSCAWNSKYLLVHVQDERMFAIGAVVVPTNVPPGQRVDLSVAMMAPASPGLHTGQWQLRDDRGALFGPVLSVSVTVTLPSPTACVPQIGAFTPDRTTINRGESTTLRWGTVTNGEHVEIDNGIGVVTTPGTHVFAPTQTTTFTLYATCGSNRVSKTVTVAVTQPTQPTSMSGSQRRDIVGTWATDKYTFQFMTVTNCAGSECQVQGEYAAWDSGPPVPGLITGTINVDTGKVVLAITVLSGPAKSFDGKVDANNRTTSGQLTGVGTITLTKQ